MAEAGFDYATLSRIGRAVGITDAAILHHYESKDAIMIAILERRDREALRATNAELPDPRGYIAHPPQDPQDALHHWILLLQQGSDTPGFAQIYVRMLAKASDTGNTAHRYFTRRDTLLRAMLTDLMDLNTSGRGQHGIADMASIMPAVFNGLMSQQFLDPSLDIMATIEETARLLLAR